MTKQVNTYVASGDVEDLAQGAGNSQIIEASYVQSEYTVGVTQGKGVYYDEEEMKDPLIVDTIMKGSAEKMVNNFTQKAIAEMKKGVNYVTCDFATTTSGYLFNCVVDALAFFGEDEEGITMLVNPKDKAYIRKQLGDDLKYSEGFVRSGYIGSVSGIPVVVSKAVPQGFAPICTKEAVTLFLKKGTEVETNRDADHRKNELYIRKVSVVALTNAKKLVALAGAQTTTATVTTGTKNTKIVAGAATTGAKVTAYVNGVKYGEATAASSAYSITGTANLTAGDKVKVVAHIDGLADSVSTEFTVAA